MNSFGDDLLSDFLVRDGIAGRDIRRCNKCREPMIGYRTLNDWPEVHHIFSLGNDRTYRRSRASRRRHSSEVNIPVHVPVKALELMKSPILSPDEQDSTEMEFQLRSVEIIRLIGLGIYSPDGPCVGWRVGVRDLDRFWQA